MPTARVIYLAGVGRSGTTLLSRLLGECPGVVNLGEFSKKLVGGQSRRLPCGCGDELEACEFWGEMISEPELDGSNMVARWSRLRLFPRILRALRGGRRGPGLERAMEDLADAFALLARQLPETEYWVDSSKHPSAAALLAGSPGIELHVIHVVRDPRSVVKSWTRPKAYLDRRPRVAALANWLVANRAANSLSPVSASFQLLRWEEFLARPGATLRRLMAGVDSDVAVPGPADGDRGFEVGVQHLVAGNPDKLQGPLIEVGTAPAGADTTLQDRVIATVARGEMRRYGYA